MLLVVGAHRSGQPLNGELTDRGARLEGVVRTAARYRLHRLDTEPPKPGLVRVRAGGASIEGELWSLPPAALGTLLGRLPQPLALGRVELADGREAVGFLCEPVAVEGSEDITAFGSWPAYRGLRSRSPAAQNIKLSPDGRRNRYTRGTLVARRARRRSLPGRASARVHGTNGIDAGGDRTLAA